MYDLAKIALKVCDTMRIAQKENPNIRKAMREFGAGFIDRLIGKNEFRLDGFSKKELALIEKLKHPKYGPLLYQIDDVYHVKTKVSENVRIRYVFESKECFELAKMIRTECFKRGCNCSLIPYFEEERKEYLSLAPEDVLFEVNPLSIAVVKNIDVSIFIGDETDPNWSKGFEKKLALGSFADLVFRNIYGRCEVRGALLSLPVERKEYYVQKGKYETVFYESLNASFEDEMKSLVGGYEKSLKGAKDIRITANDGTDLSFSIKGRPVLRDDNYNFDEDFKRETFNFPTGEVFVAPVETSANGRIVFDYVTPRGFGLIEKLSLTFKGGKVVDYAAKGDGTERFGKFLSVNTGEKDRIAELGIGCNPKAEFVGTTIVDEKILGSIHIAIGFNLGSFHGKNQASSHLDMIKIMKGKNGCVYADGKLVMKDGMPA